MGIFSTCSVCGSDWCVGAECIRSPQAKQIAAIRVLRDKLRAINANIDAGYLNGVRDDDADAAVRELLVAIDSLLDDRVG